jgi:preprotein translocase subunit SecG
MREKIIKRALTWMSIIFAIIGIGMLSYVIYKHYSSKEMDTVDTKKLKEIENISLIFLGVTLVLIITNLFIERKDKSPQTTSKNKSPQTTSKK